jgi:serine/threonine protein kinase
MSETKAPVEVGEILDQKYRVDRILGVGGMGVVVAATHVHLDERVAIKFLLPDAKSNPEVVNRFAREARAASKIKGEHVARVTDVGTLATGEPYMVMEYLQGNDLSAEIDRLGKIKPARAVGYVLQACEALAEAHQIGIIHRDLKPANLFLTQRPDGTDCIKVLDFGISKMNGGSAADAGMTKTQSSMGSPLYMSPEQMTSAKNVDARADIWSMGVVLYELLSGRSPFVGETLPEVCARILQETPEPLTSPEIPAQLDAIVQRCLQKTAAARFASMAELAAALAPFSTEDGRIAAERTQRLQGGPELPASRASFASVGQPVAPISITNAGLDPAASPAPPRSRAPLFAALGLLALAGAVGGGVLLRGEKKDDPGAATSAPPATSTPLAATSAPPPSSLPAVIPILSATPSASTPATADPPAPRPPSGKTQAPPVQQVKKTPPKPTPPSGDRRGDDRH